MKAQPTKSRTGTIVVISSLLVIGVVVGYIFWKKAKDKKDAQTKADADAKPTADTNTNQGGGTGNSGGGVGGGTVSSNMPTDVKAFQDWMDKNHPNWVNGKNLNKGSGYGNFGPATQNAWATWKNEFQNVRGTIGTTIPKPLPTTTLLSKGDAVYPVMRKIALFQYPSGNSIMGEVIANDLTKPIGVFENYSEGFAKVWFNKSGVNLNGMLIKAPYWGYVYKSLIKKK